MGRTLFEVSLMKKLYGGRKAENESRKKTTSFSSYSIVRLIFSVPRLMSLFREFRYLTRPEDSPSNGCFISAVPMGLRRMVAAGEREDPSWCSCMGRRG